MTHKKVKDFKLTSILTTKEQPKANTGRGIAFLTYSTSLALGHPTN